MAGHTLAKLDVSLVKCHCLQSLQLHVLKLGKLENLADIHVFAILTTYMETRLKCTLSRFQFRYQQIKQFKRKL